MLPGGLEVLGLAIVDPGSEGGIVKKQNVEKILQFANAGKKYFRMKNLSTKMEIQDASEENDAYIIHNGSTSFAVHAKTSFRADEESPLYYHVMTIGGTEKESITVYK